MSEDRVPPPPESTARVVERNIQALLDRKAEEARRVGWQEWVAEKITSFAGSMLFVYLHLALYGGWILLNTGWLPLKPWDPSFVMLAMMASVEAIFLSTFILITQNRMMSQADKRADLNLQISLLSEHEVTRLIHMCTRISEKLGIDPHQDPELSELSQDIAPEKVLDVIAHHESKREASY